MTKVIFGISMSLDGYINDRNGSAASLTSDLEALRNSSMLQDAIEETGAVIMGRHTYDMADDPNWYANNYEFQTPIFVVTSHPPAEKPKQTDKLTITFVTEGIQHAVEKAKAAAGYKHVTVVGGAAICQELLEANLVDELHIGIQPLLLGGGTPLFTTLTTEKKLERIAVTQEIPGRTDLAFRVIN